MFVTGLILGLIAGLLGGSAYKWAKRQWFGEKE